MAYVFVNNWIHIITYLYYININIIWINNIRFMINICCFYIKKKIIFNINYTVY